MPNSNDFARFIDELRDSRNISREDFVENIISLRQYYRFIKGESSLRSETLNALMSRLDFNTIHAYESFRKKQDKDYADLIKIYKLIHMDEYNKASVEFKSLELSSVMSKYNMQLLEFIEIKLDLHFDKITINQAVDEILELMDYEDIFKKDSLSFIELSCIMFVQDHLIKKGDYRIASYCYDILNKQNDEQFSEFKNYLLPFQLSAIKGLGKIGKNEESLKLTMKVIEEYEIYHPLNFLISIYYLKALNQRELFKNDSYLDSLTKLYSLLNIVTNQSLIKETKKLIKDIFDVSETDLIIYKTIKK
ncbi:hypothetical protein KQ51_01667 [Candidatus Izimaplasma bacterium HR1]|jgi:transcriptional regulator with XRE-family HTH domain|uniref:hypothetical protein n=1 Tax=Candidatus Izimoplasma sp. HR1 TaxID=1541959 RepID=UPI0004F7EF4C|nr:hypothetical protein KQ51_01667 [Candidatus Izimaplasma bacterium HR1]